MPNPQNPELRRSEESLRPRPELGPDPHDVGGDGGPIPPENQPGHHPEDEQDKPPADKFAEALGIKPDTEIDSEEEARKATRSAGRTAKKASARKAAARKAPAAKAASQPAAASTSSGPSGEVGGRTATRPAAETPVSPTPEPAMASATGSSGREQATAGPTGTPGAETATASAVADAARRAEPADQAARQHHHQLPDEDLPHDTGMVTPSGAPITSKVLHWPLQYWGAVLKTSGGLISAYGNALRKAGERIASGGR